MKATPYLEQVFHLIIQLLNDQGHEEIAQQLNELYELPEWIQANNPLIKKGLTKIVKDYANNNEKILRYYQNRVETQPTQEETKKSRKRSVDSHRKSISPKVKAKTRKHAKQAESPIVSNIASPKRAASPKATPTNAKGWLSKFEKPKTLEELNEVKDKIVQEEKVEVVENHTKHNKKNKKVKIESSQYESEQDDFELEPKKKLKKEVKEEKKVEKKKMKKVKQPSEEEQEEEIEEEQVAPPKKQAKKQVKPAVVKNNEAFQQKKQPSYINDPNDGYPKQSFSRINVNQVGPIRDELRDNSFQAKAKFGQQADHWGQFGYEKLRDTRGDSFKKTKGKLKNRAFQGALMDINKINSIPIA